MCGSLSCAVSQVKGNDGNINNGHIAALEFKQKILSVFRHTDMAQRMKRFATNRASKVDGTPTIITPAIIKVDGTPTIIK